MKAKTIRNLKVFSVEMVEELIIGVLYYLTWFRPWIAKGSSFPVWGKVVVGLLAVVATSVLIDAILVIFTKLRSTISSSYNSRKYREDEEEYRKNHPNEFDYAGNRIYSDDDDGDDDDDDIYDDDEEEDDEEKAEYDAAYEAGRKAAARIAAYQAGYSDYMNSLNKEKVEETEEATNETSEEEKPENSEEVDA